MRTFLFGSGGACLLALSSPAFAHSDKDFLTIAIQMNLAEIQLAELAQEKAASDQVKEYARKLEADHTQANERARAIASSLDVTAPSEPTAEQKQKAEELENLSGEAFDRAFDKLMVEEHEKAIALFEDKADDSQNEVSAFAKEALPGLQQHLSMAKELPGGTS